MPRNSAQQGGVLSRPCTRRDVLCVIFPAIFSVIFLVLLYHQLVELQTHAEVSPLLGVGVGVGVGGVELPRPLLRPQRPLGGVPQAGQPLLPSNIPDLPERKTTDQICYVRSDESELCEFDNTICWDGQGPVVVVPEPIRSNPEERLMDGYTKCFDFGALEPSSFEFSWCSIMYSSARPYAIPDDISGDIRVDHSLPLTRRRWGPLGRGDSMLFREVSPWEVYGPRDAPPLEERRVTDLIPDLTYASPGVRRKITATPGRVQEREDAELESRHKALAAGREEFQGQFEGLFKAPPPEAEVVVDWLDGPLWFIDAPSFEDHNPFHWLEKLGPLWDTQRSNGSHSLFDDWRAGGGSGGSGGGGVNEFGAHPLDSHFLWTPLLTSPTLPSRVHPSKCAYKGGSSQCHPDSPRSTTRIGGYGRLPPQSYILFASHSLQYDDTDVFLDQDWAQNMLALTAQKGRKIITPAVSRTYSPTHLLCSKRGVMPTLKPRIFSGRADAYTLRNAAYIRAGVTLDSSLLREEMGRRSGAHLESNDWPALAGFIRGSLTVPSHPKYAPRAVTFLVRGPPRVVRNMGEVVRLTQALLGEGSTPINVVDFDSRMPWAEQVRTMANTGILVAVHGAGEANTIFLPSGAAVIELFPWKFHKSTYRILASNMGHWYRDIVSKTPPDPKDASNTAHASDLAYSRRFYDRCIATNLSSTEFHFEAICNMGAKWQGIYVPLQAFREAMLDALEHISAFSLNNNQWNTVASATGVTPIPYEEWSKERPKELIDAFVESSEQYG